MTRCYCKPDMTSSWFCSQRTFQAVFHDGFCKSNHDFLIAFHSKFLSGMHGLRDNEVLLPTGYDDIVSLHQGALQVNFYDGFWKSDHDFLIAFHSNFCQGCMVSKITMFYCKLDMTSLWFIRQGALHAIFLDGFWKSDHDFMIAFHSYFYLRCVVSEITRFYCQPDMTSSWFLRQGSL